MDVDNSNDQNSGEKGNGQPNPLEQFLLLAKGARGAAAVQLVKQVLEAPGVYVFAELLDCPNIADLKNKDDQKLYHDLLEVFAYGVYEDYLKNATKLPELSEAMLIKLRHLTLVSLATGQKSLPLAELGKQLSITSTRQLEDLVIEAIYAGIISGRLDQKNGVLEVDFAIGRDIKMEELSNIATTLQEWCQTCDMMLANVDHLITQANNNKDENTKQKNALEQEIYNIQASIKAQVRDNDEPLVTESRDHDKKRPNKKSVRTGSSKFWQKSS
ncbi:UNVERIFIED_CONTAM: hypothetical protein GTU68_043487 [Idotea baltica]|nr:hypothetical protein [Idotea baltica]